MSQFRGNSVQTAVETLRNGGVIITPTDTLVSLSCDATNEEAIHKLLKIKNRSADKGLIVLVCSDAMINKCIKEVPEMAWDLMDMTDEPTTLIYDNPSDFVAHLARNVDGSLAIRMIYEGTCYDLLRRFNKPIITTSVNLEGNKPARSAAEVSKEFLSGIDYTLDIRGEGNPKASAIVSIATNGDIKIIRK